MSAFPLRIDHIVIVAGPSGAGKSTLLQQIADGRLPRELRSQLPPRARTWIQLEPGSEDLCKGAYRNAIEGAFFHYDLTRRSLAYLHDFSSDPSLGFVRNSQKITVINVRPERDRLISQWGYARYGVCALTKIRRKQVLSLITWIIHQGIRRSKIQISEATLKLRRYRPIDHLCEGLPRARPAKFRILSFYLKADGLDRLFRSWQTFVLSHLSDDRRVQQINIRPDPNAEIGKEFRWLILTADDNGEEVFPSPSKPWRILPTPLADSESSPSAPSAANGSQLGVLPPGQCPEVL